MIDFFRRLFALDFMPHGHCYFWHPEVLWLNVGSDALIALSYYSIPLALFVFVRRREDLAFKQVFVLFAAFIFACGSTHLMEAVTVWKPAYRFEGMLKLGTGLVSAATAVVLWKLMPHALTLPSPAQLAEANASLADEVRVRERAEADLRRLNAELERRVADRTEALRRSNEDLEQFAYVASHDLQEPLRAVSMYVQMLEQQYAEQLGPEGRKYVGYAVEGANRMRELIKDLLTYSRANTQDQRFCEVDAEGALRQAVANVQGALDAKKGRLTHDALPTVVADATQLTQIFQNLLSNAIKYAPNEGLHIHVSADEDGDTVTFHVRDDGIGIDPEYHEQIFEPFRRLHTRQEYPGSGLGLSICKRLTERHGGRIWVESTPGHGSTFHIRLPKKHQQGAAGADDRTDPT
ncbi:MAG: sensor histidine kinase [Myxococcota bacterium]